MQRVISQRLVGLGLVGALTLTAAWGAAAEFASGEPGENLSAIGGADTLVRLTQIGGTVTWEALEGTVSLVETVGWASSDGVHDLGGALVIERPEDSGQGVVAFGEHPRSVTFQMAD